MAEIRLQKGEEEIWKELIGCVHVIKMYMETGKCGNI